MPMMTSMMIKARIEPRQLPLLLGGLGPPNQKLRCGLCGGGGGGIKPPGPPGPPNPPGRGPPKPPPGRGPLPGLGPPKLPPPDGRDPPKLPPPRGPEECPPPTLAPPECEPPALAIDIPPVCHRLHILIKDRPVRFCWIYYTIGRKN